jgi:hypothetical protein
MKRFVAEKVAGAAPRSDPVNHVLLQSLKFRERGAALTRP